MLPGIPPANFRRKSQIEISENHGLKSAKTTEWNWRKSPNGIEKKKNGRGSAQCDVENHHQDKAKTETDGSVVTVGFRGGFGN